MPLIKHNISLKPFSNFKIGGLAKDFLEVTSEHDLTWGLKEYREDGGVGPIFILGGGTNVLLPDDEVEGLVILNKLQGISLENDLVKVASGVVFSDLMDFCWENSLSGLEWAGGLPGTVGGAIRGNAGAFGGETKDNISKTESINMNDFSKKVRNYDELRFDYRNSVFKREEGRDEFILYIYFKLNPGDQGEIKRKIEDKKQWRISKHPLDHPNIGSIFKNVPLDKVPQSLINDYDLPVKNDPFPVVPAAKLIAIAGLMGRKVRRAQVSEKHPNFIVNLGGAKSADVKELIEVERAEIKRKFGLDLEEEILIV